MEIKDLKIDQEVIINGHPYLYKGVQKITRKGFGKVQQVVFGNAEHGDKTFDLKMLSHTLKSIGNQLHF